MRRFYVSITIIFLIDLNIKIIVFNQNHFSNSDFYKSNILLQGIINSKAMKKTEHTPEMKDFIKEHSYLWWWVPEDKKEFLSLDSIVEAILNYGYVKDIKKLFEIAGIEKVSGTFFKHIAGMRPNYSKKTINYFNIYFQRHAQRNFN